MQRVWIAAITVFIFIASLGACSPQKSDEELIEARIDEFLTAYNTGDLDAVLNCLDAKTRNAYKSAIGITEALGGAVPNVGGILGEISISDLFGISIGIMSKGDVLMVDIRQINIQDGTTATVDVTMGYKDKLDAFSSEAVFTMLKENGNWYIKNFEDKNNGRK